MIKPLWSGVMLLDGKKFKEVMPWTLLYPYICFKPKQSSMKKYELSLTDLGKTRLDKL